MITSTTSGTWILWDTYSKVNASRWRPTGVSLFGSGAGSVIGANINIQYSSPIQIGGTSWRSISAGASYTLATKTDGTLWAWGNNNYGELGQNNRVYYSSPIQISGTGWNFANAGGGNSGVASAIKTDGTLWAWGLNEYGQLGLNNTSPRSSPVQIPGTSWVFCSSANFYSFATKTDGTLWAWGSNFSGQLGLNNTTLYSSPVQIPGTQWNFVNATSFGGLATKTGGTLWSWGWNYSGLLGQNNTTQYSSPIQIPGQWQSISGGGGHVLATKTDGTLWSWGFNGANSHGRLGLNDINPRSSPAQIPGTQWSSIISAGSPRASASGNSMAIKTDGTLWAWGGGGGALAQNTSTVQYSSPVQIPGTNWIDVSSGESASIMLQNVFI